MAKRRGHGEGAIYQRESDGKEVADKLKALHLAQGVPLVVVRDTLGHTQISTTADIYGHVLPESQRQAANRIDALLGGDVDVDVPPAEPEDE